MNPRNYQNIILAISKLEKKISQVQKRVTRYEMLLSVPQVNDEKEKIEKMLAINYEELEELKIQLNGVKWLLE